MSDMGRESNKTYLYVKLGRLRKRVLEGTEGAKLRSGTLKDGSKFEKWELVYTFIKGFITGIFYDETGQFGARWNINIKGEEGEYVVQLKADAKDTIDFLQRLPNVDFSQPVKLSPYKFEDSGNSGIVIWQGDNKLKNYFVEVTFGKAKGLHGYPLAQKGTKGDKYKLYALQRDMFLKDFIIENVVSKLKGITEPLEEPADVPMQEDDDDLPF